MSVLGEPDHVDEPQKVQAYWGLVSRVAAMITVEHLELLRELLAQHEAEQLAAQVDWAQAAQVSPPPPHWFEGDDPKPF
jgi:uncharacterized protein (DUF2267 family)